MNQASTDQYRVLAKDEIAGFLGKIDKVAQLIGGDPDDWRVADVADGHLNAVYLVEGSRSGVCVKQSLPWVRVAKDDWPLPVERAYFESEYMRRVEPFVDGRAPRLLHFDPVLYVIVMERLRPHIVLRQGLIDGHRYPLMAESVADYVAAATFFTSDIANGFERKFSDLSIFARNHGLQRITLDLVFTDPCVDVWRNRYARPQLDAWARALRDDAPLKAALARHRLIYLNRPQALLHGDLHTGSVMVSDDDTRVIDGEFACVGPIGFDTGAFIGNLLLAWFALSVPGEGTDRQADSRDWIGRQITRFWERFRSSFLAHWEAYQGPSDGYPASHFGGDSGRASLKTLQNEFLDAVLADTLAYAAIEMIRRVIGFAQVADFSVISDPQQRAMAQAGALSLARDVLVHAQRYPTLDALLAAAPDHERAGLEPANAPAYRALSAQCHLFLPPLTSPNTIPMSHKNPEFSVATVLLDIEGTLSSQSFVTQVLYPYVQKRLRDYVARHTDDPVVRQALADTRALSGKPDEDPVDSLLGWLAEDRKAPPLKKLQGLVWESGFVDGAFQGQIFPDALKALQLWHAQGIPLVIYSSGSVQCQKQFYQYNEAGDLLHLFFGHFDTDIGAKVDQTSYTRILDELEQVAGEVLFLSDNPRELVAAQAAGIKVVQVLREGLAADPRFLAISDFSEISVTPALTVAA